MKNRRHWILGMARTAAVALLVLGLAGCASYGGSTRAADREEMIGYLKEIDAHIAAERWQDGDTSCGYVTTQLARRRPDHRRPAALYGKLLGLCSMVRAGLGDDEGAAWSWYSALALDPSAREVASDRFGAVAEQVRSLPDRQPPESSWEIESGIWPTTVRLVDGSQVEGTGPVRQTSQPIEYITGGRLAPRQGELRVEAIVGTDGRLRQPVILYSDASPLQEFVALQALEGWTFKPAEVGGAPRDVVSVFDFGYSTERPVTRHEQREYTRDRETTP